MNIFFGLLPIVPQSDFGTFLVLSTSSTFISEQVYLSFDFKNVISLVTFEVLVISLTVIFGTSELVFTVEIQGVLC